MVFLWFSHRFSTIFNPSLAGHEVQALGVLQHGAGIGIGLGWNWWGNRAPVVTWWNWCEKLEDVENDPLWPIHRWFPHWNLYLLRIVDESMGNIWTNCGGTRDIGEKDGALVELFEGYLPWIFLWFCRDDNVIILGYWWIYPSGKN